jgi:hypothetical protein
LQERGSTNIIVQDPMLYLQANVLYPWIYDTGVYSDSIGGPANTYVHHGIVRSYTNNYWGFFSNVQSEPDATVNWNDTGLIWDKIKVGDIVLANTTAASSATSGALQVAGGAGIAGALYTGGLGQHGAGLQSTPIGNATPSTGAFTTLTNSGVHTSSGNLVAQSGTASTSSTTGALVVNGGAGITGNVYTGSAIYAGGIVSASQSGFQSATYSSGRNRIWSFGNADAYGISYFQGSGGFAGTTDMIGMHFGTASVAGSAFSFVGSGNFYATGDIFSSYSDDNLKTRLGSIEDPIGMIKKIETFYYKPNDLALSLGIADGRKVGLSAQGLLNVVPEAVHKRPDGYLTAQYERLVPLLVETCKAQQAMIEKLQEEVADLKRKL